VGYPQAIEEPLREGGGLEVLRCEQSVTGVNKSLCTGSRGAGEGKTPT
jgi:hypothetical protein